MCVCVCVCIIFAAIASTYILCGLHTLPLVYIGHPLAIPQIRKRIRRTQYIILYILYTICTYSHVYYMHPNQDKTMRSRCIENT